MAKSRLFVLVLSVLTPESVFALPELSITKLRGSAVNAVGRRSVGPQVNDITSQPTWGSLEYYTTSTCRYMHVLQTLIMYVVTVGTPPVEQTVILGTGSSDLYFDASSAEECQADNASSPTGCRGGSFDPSRSTTYNIVRPAPAFNITYGDGSTAVGPYAVDVVGIGNVAISGVEFGLAENFSVTVGNSVGILGLGYYTNEAVNSTSDLYPNLVDVMVHAGVINSRLYSIYLGDAGAFLRRSL